MQLPDELRPEVDPSTGDAEPALAGDRVDHPEQLGG
ncbi:hypothetical protein BDK92_5170 [Micromonospora pisi]|uniref:Uncharacterized protein n=1 Tax=Micromonospora pisi TaxID=589240 RepID=A0A495JRV2_9ACTN|nr:hypothetical protein BDK92_5170 [Micromonospora pisi]